MTAYKDLLTGAMVSKDSKGFVRVTSDPDNDGVTRYSLDCLRYIPLIGTIERVTGIPAVPGARHPDTVIVAGSKGCITFCGFSWGYGGEGPHGLADLFNQIGLDVSPSRLIRGVKFKFDCKEWGWEHDFS